MRAPSGACPGVQGYAPASRRRACQGDYPRLTGTTFPKTRQRPAPLLLLLRGITKGEPSPARLPRVYTQHLHLSVTIYAAMIHTKQVTPKLMRRIRDRDASAGSHYP